MKQFESAEMKGKTFTNTTDKNAAFQCFLFPNGEMIIQTAIGECFHLDRDQVGKLFTFFSGERVKMRMLDTLRANLWAAGGACRSLIRMIDKTPPFDGASQ